MVPFSGVNLGDTDPPKEWFNFWHSQLRINIECAFGIFISRWGIFWKNLRYKTRQIIAIVHACCRLHNFCIDRNLPILDATYEPSQAPWAALTPDGTLADPEYAQVNPNDGNSDAWERTGNVLREKILQKVTDRGLAHSRNIVRQF